MIIEKEIWLEKARSVYCVHIKKQMQNKKYNYRRQWLKDLHRKLFEVSEKAFVISLESHFQIVSSYIISC